MTVAPDVLRQFELFTGFTDEELAEIASFCREEHCVHNGSLFSEGDSADRLYLVLKGKVSLEKEVRLGRSGSSRQATVSVRGAGNAIGWSCLVEPHIYTMSAVCMEPTEVLVIEGRDMHRFMSRDSEGGLKLMRAVAALVRERMEDTTSTLTYFLSIIAHELKSPMAAIENYLEVMLGGFAGDFTDKQRRMLERSALRLKDLRNLINDILDLARMRPEHIQADFDWFDPGEIGNEAIEDVRLAAQEKEITIKVQLDSAAKFQQMVGARRRLRQVLTNLLSNAIKFSPQGSVVVLHARQDDDQLVVEVMDEGVGISPEERDHVFEDFFRGHNVDRIGGSGLGLSIAKKIVDAHQGQIGLESPYAEGKPGTKFTVVIPRNLSTPAMKRQAWRSEKEVT